MKRRSSSGLLFALFAMGVFLAPAMARAAIIDVGPTDDYKKIEGAVAGDTVLIAPGTYKFRVYLSKSGTASAPIVIKAKDPTKPPVFDLAGKLVEDWPGSYTAGDRGRGCWQITGGYYEISGIVITNCTTSSQNAAGVRFYGSASNLTFRDMVFRKNDNGVTGSGDKILIEFSEFDSNGNTGASAPTHNMYIYGGDYTLRYSYVHDSTQGQNFHLRCLTCLLEYNWIARGNSYEGDLMTNDAGTATLQRLTMRGNVLVQKSAPLNGSQVLVMYNDTGTTGVSMEMDLYWNTFIGNGKGAGFVHHTNSGLKSTRSVLSNNVIVGNTKTFTIDNPGSATTAGTNNWLVTGTTSTGSLAGSIFGASATLDANYRPLVGSPVIGKADLTVTPLPVAEYFQNETIKELYRARGSAKDLGAFESTTTGPGIGPYGTPPPDAGPSDTDGAPSGDADAPGPVDAIPPADSPGTDSTTGGDGGPAAAPPSGGDEGGCRCALVGRTEDASDLALVAVGIGALCFLRPRRSYHVKKRQRLE